MSLAVSEFFFSLQGEGVSLGKPALFLRLQGCNLLCEGKDWRCDTIEVWQKGKRFDDDTLLSLWQQRGFIVALEKGAHLVITGGEPLLQQKGLMLFLNKLDACLETPCFIEVESNATLKASSYLLQRVNQWNLSPKLQNAGMPFKRRVQAEVLRDFVACQKAFFKFVIVSESDLKEIRETFVDLYSISHERVILMPAAGTQRELYARLLECKRWAEKEGYAYSSRLQLQIWDEATGV